jgi:hypothetical protein
MIIKSVKILNKDEKDESEIPIRTVSENLEMLQILREQYIYFFNKEKEYNESREGLRRVYRIIERKQS